jgi:hypothetical protein
MAWFTAVMTASTLAALSLVVRKGESWVSQRAPQVALQAEPQSTTSMGGAEPPL